MLDSITQTTACIDKDLFSCISARKGRLSTTIEAGVPECVLFSQKWHSLSKAASAYMALDSHISLSTRDRCSRSETTDAFPLQSDLAPSRPSKSPHRTNSSLWHLELMWNETPPEG